MSKTKILYVEDELFLGKIVKESLESRQFEVVMESDGTHVLNTFKRINPDVCVLDVMLPNKDGFTIAGEIREVNANVPIIFLTAKTQTDDLVKGFSMGGNDYIRKPFSMEELIARIKNVLRKTENVSLPSNEPIRLGKFRFYTNRQLLSNGVEEKKLSYRESELLRILYENRNSIINRKNILDLLW